MNLDLFILFANLSAEKKGFLKSGNVDALHTRQQMLKIA